MVAGIIVDPVLFVCLQAFIIIIMLLEYYNMLWGKRRWLQQALGIATGLTLLFASTQIISCLYVLIPWAATFIIQLYRKEKEPFTVIAQNLSGVLYVALPVALLSYFVYDAAGNFNGYILLACFIILWSNDVGAYLSGILFGRKGKHKLFPSISPKKSWEGFIGGLCVAVAAGYVMSFHYLPFALHHCLIIALLIGIFGVWGDLVESQLKRSVNAKDSGTIMPGHGGLLDRFDASLVAMPMALLYMKLALLL
jgi:phosphatidate cytidylyltransferase